MILDEAQSIKNQNTQTSKELSKIPARWRLGLSGTPIENNLSELWSIFRVISPGLLASFSTFRKRFVIPIQKNGSEKQRETLKKIVSPFIMRRLKTEILDELPEKVETVKYIALSERETKFYEAARLEAREKLEKKKAKLSSQYEQEGLNEKQIEEKLKALLSLMFWAL